MSPKLSLLLIATLAWIGRAEADDVGRTVRASLDTLARAELRLAHSELPSPRRYRELMGRDRGRGAKPPEHPAVRAILRMGTRAVPALSVALRNPEHRSNAAYLLAEIGGESAAASLFAEWSRAVRKARRVYAPNGSHSFGGPDGIGLGEVEAALCWSGKPVVSSLVRETQKALRELHELRSTGKALFRESEDEGRPGLVACVPLGVALSGVHVLAMIGDPEGAEVFARALRFPVRTLRDAALRGAFWFASEKLLPALDELLRDSSVFDERRKTRVQDAALEAAAFTLARKTVRADKLTVARRDALIRHYRARIAERRDSK